MTCLREAAGRVANSPSGNPATAAFHAKQDSRNGWSVSAALRERRHWPELDPVAASHGRGRRRWRTVCLGRRRMARMGVQREGGCACGAVRYRLGSQPMFIHCCHCLNCQRQTGSAFVVNLLIEADRVQVFAGAPQPVDAPRDDGSAQRIFRCPECQVAIFSETARRKCASYAAERSTIRPASRPTCTSTVAEGRVGDPPGGNTGVRRLLRPRRLWSSESLSRLEAVLPRT